MLKESNGFTLVELIITVVVMSILAAVAYPSYVRFVKSGQAEQARAVINALVSAEKIARERGGSCVAGTPAGWVSISTGDGIYTVDSERIDTGEAPDFEFRITNVAADSCRVTARGTGGLFTSADTLVCDYDATANPRQAWSGNINDYI